MTNHNLFYDKKLTVMLYSTDEYRLWGPYTVDLLNKQMVLQSNYSERWWFFIASLKEVKVFHQDICNLLRAIEFDIRFFQLICCHATFHGRMKMRVYFSSPNLQQKQMIKIAIDVSSLTMEIKCWLFLPQWIIYKLIKQTLNCKTVAILHY